MKIIVISCVFLCLDNVQKYSYSWKPNTSLLFNFVKNNILPEYNMIHVRKMYK